MKKCFKPPQRSQSNRCNGLLGDGYNKTEISHTGGVAKTGAIRSSGRWTRIGEEGMEMKREDDWKNRGDTLRNSGEWRKNAYVRRGKGGIERKKKEDWRRSAGRPKNSSDLKRRGNFRRRGVLKNNEGVPKNNED